MSVRMSVRMSQYPPTHVTAGAHTQVQAQPLASETITAAYIVMAYIGMAHIVMAYIGMAYIVMAAWSPI